MRRKAGWAGVLLAATLLGVGCSNAPSDRQIATNLQSEMFSDPQLKDSSLSVAVKNGVATLSGQVPSVAARYEAFKVASETAGVKKVDDQMTVQEPLQANGSPAHKTHAKPARTRERSKSRHRPVLHHAEPAPAPQQTQTAAADQPEQTDASQPEPAAPAPAPEPPAPPPIEVLTVPQGAKVSVRMIDSIDSSVSHTGDIFHGSLASPLVVGKQIVAPKGSDVYLRLVEARSAGHLTGRSELRVELYRLVIDGKSYPLISNDYEVKGPSRTKRSTLAIIGGAVAGAAIGAIAGGGKGAAIGAAAGGGGGAAYEGLTKSKQADIPSEALIHFRLDQPLDVTLTLPPSGASNPNPNPNP